MNKSEFKKIINIEVYRLNSKDKHISIREKIFLKYVNPSTSAVFLLRKMQYYNSFNDKLSKIITAILHAKLCKTFSICVDPNCEIGIGLHLPHPIGIVLGSAVKIGKNCSIYQNVTIGGARIGDAKKKSQPIIGDNCVFFTSSMVLGSIVVTDECLLGANSTLLKDATISGIYVGSPAKLINRLGGKV